MSKSRPRLLITEKNPTQPDKSVSPRTRTRKKSARKDAPRSAFGKRTAAISRWLHIYLSMVSFAVLLFFAVTGLTLNHAEWFAGEAKTTKYTGAMPSGWVNSPDTSKVSKLEVVEFLRNKYGVKGYVSDFAIYDSECSVTFKGPGYSSDIFISRETGEYELSETRMGLVAVMNDLHKGRDSGSKWAWVIDVSAVLMTVVSLSGLILILFIKRKRSSGLIVAAAGLILSYLIYRFFVP